MISPRTFWHRLAPPVFIAALLLALLGCTPPHRDPPHYFESSAAAAQIAAQLHATEVHGTFYYVLDTHSMEPLLHGGDLVVVAPSPFASLQLGQIILYRADWLPADSPPVCHRLAQRDSGGWILSGDNNPRSEPSWRVTERNYLGLVVSIWSVKK